MLENEIMFPFSGKEINKIFFQEPFMDPILQMEVPS